MSKYIMIYSGPASDVSEMTEAQGKAVMEKWGAWMGKVGGAIVDVGSPFGPGTSVVDDGSARRSAELSGYSIVEAASLEAAKALTDGHPFLSEGKGKYAIEVFELVPVPF